MSLDDIVIHMRERMYHDLRKQTFLKFYKNIEILNVCVDKSRMYDDGILDDIYNINKSITQSLRSTTGRDFEKCIAHVLSLSGISYSQQIYVSCDDGKVFKKKPKAKCHRVDFIVPELKTNEDLLEKYIILSCKTTLRDRYLQDNMYKNIFTISMDDNVKIDNLIVIKPNGNQLETFVKYLAKFY